jgi:hypothetical protein
MIVKPETINLGYVQIEKYMSTPKGGIIILHPIQPGREFGLAQP